MSKEAAFKLVRGCLCPLLSTRVHRREAVHNKTPFTLWDAPLRMAHLMEGEQRVIAHATEMTLRGCVFLRSKGRVKADIQLTNPDRDEASDDVPYR